MLSRELGGIQQAYLDYSEALKVNNYDVINISSTGGLINKKLNSEFKLPNIGSWCIFSKIMLWLLVMIYKPKAIICHGNRAINFASAFKTKNTIIIGVAHNYTYKQLAKCDYVLTLTLALKEHLSKHGIHREKLLDLPNMIKITKEYEKRDFHFPIVIGSMGRFVAKKGYSHLIEAISILKTKGHHVKLIIGGDGEEKNILKAKIEKLDLAHEVYIEGWIDDKESFFEKIDIFCLPSISEPFGIIILEAMSFSKPVVATESGGPQEIIDHNVTGLLCMAGSAEHLAASLAKIISDKQLADDISYNAYLKLKEEYDAAIVAKRLSNLLTQLILRKTDYERKSL